MVNAVEHDPFSLFDYAIRESDWILADLLAERLGASEAARMRLRQELEASSGRLGRPGSLPDLHRLARLTRSLNLEDEAG